METTSPETAAPGWLQRAAAISWRVLVVGAALYCAALAIGFLHVVVVPLALALFVVALLDPVASWFEKFMPASLAAFLALLLGTGALLGALIVVGLNVAHRLPEMGDALRQSWDSLLQSIAGLPFGPDKAEVIESLRAVGSDIGSQAGEVVRRLLSGAQSLFLIVSQLLLTMAFSFFFMRDGKKLFGQTVHRFNDSREARLRAAGERAWRTLGRYFRGLSLIALANALMKAAALLLVGIPMVLPIAVLMFIGSFVPFAGPIVAGTIAALVALTHGGLTDALLIVAASVGIQVVEGNVLQPYIFGRTLHLHPIVVLAGVVTGAAVAGLGGAFLAIPLIAAAKNAFNAMQEVAAEEEEEEEETGGDVAKSRA